MSNDEPVFVVKFTGILSPEDIERYERGFQEQLPGRVIVTDNRVEDVHKMTDVQPRDAIVTVHHKRKQFKSIGCDGNTPIYETVEEIELVNARVWPVSMGPDEMLVEYEDGRLGTARLRDIRLGNRS